MGEDGGQERGEEEEKGIGRKEKEEEEEGRERILLGRRFGIIVRNIGLGKVFFLLIQVKCNIDFGSNRVQSYKALGKVYQTFIIVKVFSYPEGH